MKLSVSVPDSLWEAAVNASEHASPSAVVQEALKKLVWDAAVVSYDGDVKAVSFT